MPGPDPLLRYLEGDLPAPVALMQLVRQSASPGDLAARLSRPVSADAEPRLAVLRGLAERHGGAFEMIHRVLDLADHARAGQAAASAWARVFDEIAVDAAAAASALYAFGDDDLMTATSAEIVTVLRRDGYLVDRSTVADIGCGVGRLMPALAETAGLVVGLDVSAVMLAETRRRLAGLPRTALVRIAGDGLPMVRSASIDLALVVDVMPYVPSEPSTRRRWMEDLARVLKAGGSLVIMNWSYASEPAEHSREIADATKGLPFHLVRNGDRPFSLWDGAVFALARV